MATTDRVEEFLQGLRLELEKAAPSIGGVVSPGSVEFPEVGAALQVQFPGVKGTYGTVPVWITFSIASDCSQLLAGQPINKPTVTMVDYLRPWLQVYAYQRCPFVLWVTPERTDIMTKITRALRLESSGLRSGWPELDDRYLLDCRSGRESAEGFLRTPAARDALQVLGELHLLSFGQTHIKLVTSVEKPGDCESETVLKHVRALSRLADLLRSVDR